MFKTPLLKYLKICMDLSVASSLHGMKITAEQGLKSATASTLLSKLDALSTQITKNTWMSPLERWHGIDQNTCRHQPYRMHTSNKEKMTNEQVITVSAD